MNPEQQIKTLERIRDTKRNIESLNMSRLNLESEVKKLEVLLKEIPVLEQHISVILSNLFLEECILFVQHGIVLVKDLVKHSSKEMAKIGISTYRMWRIKRMLQEKKLSLKGDKLLYIFYNLNLEKLRALSIRVLPLDEKVLLFLERHNLKTVGSAYDELYLCDENKCRAFSSRKKNIRSEFLDAMRHSELEFFMYCT